MAKFLQIFVLALALAQGYCAIVIPSFPGSSVVAPPAVQPPVTSEIETMPFPVAPEQPELPPIQPAVDPSVPAQPEQPVESVQPAQPATPPCVSVLKAILQAIIDRLGNIPELVVPLPEDVEPVEAPPVPDTPNTPEVPEVQANPCSACFEHIKSLLSTAQRLATLKALSRQ